MLNFAFLHCKIWQTLLCKVQHVLNIPGFMTFKIHHKFRKSYLTVIINAADLIICTLVQNFLARHNVILRTQSGKLHVLSKFQELIERRVLYFLCYVTGYLAPGTLKERTLKNCDKTHFVINDDDGNTLHFRQDQESCYYDITSGDDEKTVMAHITSGPHYHIAIQF